MSSEDIEKDYYCKYICNKSLLRSITLMVPVLGQLLVLSYDWAKGVGNGTSLVNATPEQQNDEAYVLQYLANVKNKKEINTPNPLLNNPEFMQKAMKLYGSDKILYAGEEVKSSPDFFRKTLNFDNAYIIKNASENLIRDPEFFFQLMKQAINNTYKNPVPTVFIKHISENDVLREALIKACGKGDEDMLKIAMQLSESLSSRQEIRNLWENIYKLNPQAISNWVEADKSLKLDSGYLFNKLKETKDTNFFKIAYTRYDIVILALFFDESKFLYLSDEQTKIVDQIRKRNKRPSITEGKEHQILSEEAAKTYENMKKTENLMVPVNTSEAVQQELQSYVQMTRNEDSMKNISKKNIKINLIKNLNLLVNFINLELNDLKVPSRLPRNAPDTKLIAEKIQNIINILPGYLSDKEGYDDIGTNLEKIKIVKHELVKVLSELDSDQIQRASDILYSRENNDPFLSDVFKVARMLKRR